MARGREAVFAFPVFFALRYAYLITPSPESHKSFYFNEIELEGKIGLPPSFGDFGASRERFPGSLRSPTLEPSRQTPRKPAVRGAIQEGEMQGWKTNCSQQAIRTIAPNQLITGQAIDKIDHS